MALVDFALPIPFTLFAGRDRSFFIDNGIESITFDLLLDESHDMPMEVTQYNVEEGSDISENIHLPPRTGNITGFASNLSLNVETSILEPFVTPANFAQTVFDSLLYIRDQKLPVDLITNLALYEQVLLTGISASRSADNGESQEFEISFTEMRIVKLQTVAITTSVQPLTMKKSIDRQVALQRSMGRR